jgi:predicted ATPase
MPFLGRTADLQKLDALLRDCLQLRSARMALLLGEAGVGKSRLCREWARRVDNGLADVVSVRATPEGVGSAHPLRDLARIVAAPRERPLIVIAEDLQWADWMSIGSLRGSLERAESSPLFILATARTNAARPLRAFSGSKRCVVLHLGALPSSDCELLVRRALGPRGGGVRGVVADSRGNPLLLRERIRWEQNANERPSASLLALVQSTITSLDVVDRRIVRAAGRLGRVFTVDALKAAVGPLFETTSVEARLAHLEEVGIVEREGAKGARIYRFKSDLLHQVALSMTVGLGSPVRQVQVEADCSTWPSRWTA